MGLTEAEQQSYDRSKAHLDQVIGELVHAIADVGEARIAAEEHRMASDNFKHAAEHRRVTEAAKRTFERAVDAYVRLRRGPQPETT